jgi:hypothetical protein
VTVRTNNLAHLVGIGPASAVVYTTPAGLRTLVKDGSFRVQSGGPTDLTVFVSRGGVGVTVFYAAGLATGAFVSFSGRSVVLEPGDLLEVNGSSGTFSVSVSGAELALP